MNGPRDGKLVAPPSAPEHDHLVEVWARDHEAGSDQLVSVHFRDESGDYDRLWPPHFQSERPVTWEQLVVRAWTAGRYVYLVPPDAPQHDPFGTIRIRSLPHAERLEIVIATHPHTYSERWVRLDDPGQLPVKDDDVAAVFGWRKLTREEAAQFIADPRVC